MELFEIVELALDEAIAMDGDENAVRASGWLQQHDDRYHGGHYEEGQRCKLREKLASQDNADRLGGVDNALQWLRNAPSRDAFAGLIDRLHRDGTIDDETANDISRMVNGAFSELDRADDDDFERHDELRDSLLALNEVYQALHEAYPEEPTAETALEQPASPAQGQPAAEPAAQNAEPQNAPADAPVAPFSQTRALPQNHWLRSTQITMQHGDPSQTQGMKVHFTDASQVTPRVLADIFMRLPRGNPPLWNHHVPTRTCDVDGRRVPLFEALQTMVTDPDSPVGKSMRERLAHQDNPWSRRLNEIMNVLRDGQAEDAGVTAADQNTVTREQVIAEYNRMRDMPRHFDIRSIASANRAVHQQDMQNVTTQAMAQSWDNSTNPDGEVLQYDHGCNCWKSVFARLLHIRGFGVYAANSHENVPQRIAFFGSQAGCARAYERVNQSSELDTARALRRMAFGDADGHPPAMPYPNGTFINRWDGGHCKSVVLWEGRFYCQDTWRGGSWREISPESLAGSMYSCSTASAKRSLEDVLAMGDSARSQIRQYRELARTDPSRVPEQVRLAKFWLVAYAKTKRDMINAMRANGTQGEPTQRQIVEECARNANVLNDVNGSFVIKPTDPIIPEIFNLMHDGYNATMCPPGGGL